MSTGVCIDIGGFIITIIFYFNCIPKYISLSMIQFLGEQSQSLDSRGSLLSFVLFGVFF